MTDKVQKIKEWISKTQDCLMDDNGNFENTSDEGAFHILSNLDYYIDSLQEEPVSEDLEEAAKQYAKDYPFTAAPTRSLTDHFKAGANWQKQQTIDKAAEWLSELDDALFLGYDNDGYPYIGRGGLVEDFKKYMED